MSTLTTYASAAARDSASPASDNTGLCIFRSDTKAIEVSDGVVYRAFNNDGVYSQVANFDGAGDYIDTNEKFDFIQKTCEFTLTCWVKFADHASTAANQFLLGNNNSGGQVGMMLWYDNRSTSGSNKQLRVVVSPDVGGSSGDIYVNVTNGITDDNWHHIAVTGSGNGGTLKMYRDGSLIGSTSGLTTTTSTSLHDMLFGAVGTTPTGFFKGALDEVAIFNSELSSNEINNLVSSHNYTGATSLYKFEGNADDSIGTNDGTNNNATFEGALVAL